MKLTFRVEQVISFNILMLSFLLINNVYAEKLTAVTENLSFLQHKKDGQISGYAVDVINELSNIAGEDIEIQMLPWARALHIAENKPNTLIFSIARTLERENHFIWGGVLLDSPLYIWKLKNQESESNNHYFIKDNDVYGASRMSAGFEYLKMQKVSNIHIVNTQAQTLKLLFNKRVDFIISSEEGINYRLKKLNLDSSLLVKLTSDIKMNQRLYFAFSLGTNPNIIEKYNKAFEVFINTERFLYLKNKWNINIQH